MGEHDGDTNLKPRYLKPSSLMPSVKGQGSSFKEDYWCGDKIFGLVHIVDSSVDFSSVGRLDGFLPRCQRGSQRYNTMSALRMRRARGELEWERRRQISSASMFGETLRLRRHKVYVASPGSCLLYHRNGPDRERILMQCGASFSGDR